jgi:hypothetical protein
MKRFSTIIQAGVVLALFIATSVIIWSYSRPQQQRPVTSWVGNVG